MIFSYIVICLFINTVYTVNHVKSYVVDDLSSGLDVFDFDQGSLYVMYSNDIIQRDFETGNVIRTLRGHSSAVLSIFFVNGTLISGSSDGLVVQWDLQSGSILKRLDTKTAIEEMIWFEGKLLITCTTVQSIMVDFNTGKVLQLFDVNQYFYVYGNVFYAFQTQIGLVVYPSNYVYNYVVSAVVRSEDSIYTAGKLDYKVFEISILNGTFYFFSGAGHTSNVLALCLIDRYLISGSYDARVILWDIYSKSQITILKCNLGNVYTIHKYNSSTIIFGDSGTSEVVLYDFIKKEKLKSFTGRQNYLFSLAVYQDYLFSGSPEVQIKEWSSSSRLLLPLKNNSLTGYKLFVYSNYLLNCYSSITVRDLTTDTLIKEFARDEVDCWNFYFLDGFVYAPANYLILKFNLSSEENVLKFFDHQITSEGKNLVASDSYLYVCYFQNILVQWDLNTGNLLNTAGSVPFFAVFTNFNGGSIIVAYFYYVKLIVPSTFEFNTLTTLSDNVYTAAFDEQTGILFIGFSSLIKGFDSNNEYQVVYNFAGHLNFINNILIQGDFMFSSSNDGTVKQWSLITKRLVYSFEERGQSITSLVCFNDILMFGTLDGTLYEFQISTSYFLQKSTYSENSITDMILYLDMVFIGFADQTIVVLNYSSVSLFIIRTFSTPLSLFCQTGRLFSGDIDHKIAQWNLTSKESVKIFTGHDASINDIIVEGSTLYSGGSDTLICRWDLNLAEITLTYKGHSDEVSSILLYLDVLYSSSLDKTIIVWDTSTGAISRILKRTLNVLGHLGPVNKIVICNNNLFSASGDLTIKQWDLASYSVLDTMFGHTKEVTTIYCLSKALFSGSADFAAYLWYPVFEDTITSKQNTKLMSSVAQEKPSTFQISSSSQLIIIPVGVGVSVILIIFAIFAIRRFIYKDGFNISYEVANSTSTKTDTSFLEGATTLFTRNAGIAIPGYLEMVPSSFRLLEQIAKGGGGSIFIAEIFGKKEKIIAKLFKQDYSELSPMMRAAFDQEVTLMEFLKPGPNIAKIVGFSRTPCCIFMKFYSKGSLRKLLDSNEKIKIHSKVKFLLDISNGIQYLHTKAVVHGDLKPDNILIDYDENGMFLVLTDFGIASITSDKFVQVSQFQIANLRGLSIKYAAPEVFKRFRQQISESRLQPSDLYSFAVIINEIISRTPPWS